MFTMKEKLNPLDIVPKANDYIDLDNIQSPTKQQEKQFKKSYAYYKYVKKYDVARKRKKFILLKIWFKQHFFGIIRPVISFYRRPTNHLPIYRLYTCIHKVSEFNTTAIDNIK